MIAIATSVEYRDLPPSQIVPKLAEKGIYIASESIFYRILKLAEFNARQLNTRPKTYLGPVFVIANEANQVWSWDITFEKPHPWSVFFMYLIMDAFSRMIVGH